MASRGKRKFPNVLIGVFCGIGVLGSLPSSVRAEVSLDLYGGLATTQSAEVEGKFTFRPENGPTTNEKFRDETQLKDSFTVGGRVSYWTERFPWAGVAFDASYFNPEAKNPKIDINPVIGLSVLLMLRYPLFTNEQFPNGRLQPYLGIGPELAFTKISAEFEDNTGTRKIKEHASGGGIDIRAGVLWQFHQRWGIFTEYRFTHIGFDTKSPFNFYDVDDIDEEDIPEGGFKSEDLETTLTTHHFLIGLSFRF
jgi:outer membrane protein W